MDKKATTIIMVMSTITTGMGMGTMNTPTHKKSMADGAWNLILARPLTLHDQGQ